MKTISTDLWTLEATHLIVIPTNYGWKDNGSNVMGRGLASQALERYPHVARAYGKHCREHYAKTEDVFEVPIFRYLNLILAASKPLNVMSPWLSWKQKSHPDTIRSSLEQLKGLLVPVAVPLLGAGNGGLDPKTIQELTVSILGEEENITLVLPPVR